MGKAGASIGSKANKRKYNYKIITSKNQNIKTDREKGEVSLIIFKLKINNMLYNW